VWPADRQDVFFVGLVMAGLLLFELLNDCFLFTVDCYCIIISFGKLRLCSLLFDK